MTPSSPPARSRHLVALAVAIGLAVPAALVVPEAAHAAGGQGLVAGAPVFTDSFTRSTSGGWGSSSGAAPYSHDVSSAFRVNGARGVIDLGRSGMAAAASLPASVPADSESTVRITMPRVPSAGNGVSVGLQQRVTGSSYYQSTVRVDGGGTAYLSVIRVTGSTAAQTTLVPGAVVARGVQPGQAVTLQSRVSGSGTVSVDARAWLDGQATPAWQAVASDTSGARLASGSGARVWSYLSASSGPQAVSFDDLAVRPLTASTAPAAPTPAPTTPAPAPAPAPVPAPATGTGDAEQAIPLADARPGSGSAPVGSTRYPVPSNALFVATTGSDRASGSASAPFRSIQRAVDVAASGRTIVVRGGTYHESVVMPEGEALTLQSYPGEKVWLDGSRTLTQWVASGSGWYAPGWDLSFDTSPTYTRGAPDGTAASWSFVNPAFPLAAHPDQVWFGGTAQRQVATRAQVVPGTFFVDRAADRLHVGSDPRSSSVRSSDLVSALQVRGDGSTVRGIGIRRYAPSVPDQGAVQIHGTRVAFENVAITDIATIGLSVMATDAKLTAVTSARNGMLGMRAVYADRLVATRLLVADNNLERFNRAPVSGGFKIGRSRDIQVLDSDFQRNAGNGLWFDESVYDITLTGNDVLDNTGAGIVLELSATATVADNVIARSGEEGLWIENSGHIGVWNNTFSANDRDIDISQGDRIATNLSTAGHDPRQKLPDPTVTWVVTDITISNNVLQGSTGNALLAVEDHTHKRSAAQMGIRTSGNVYQRDQANSPGWAVVWTRGPGNPAVYGTLAAFRDATGNDRTGLEVIGRRVLGSDLRITGEIASLQSGIAVGVPALVASLTGIVTGSRTVGATAG